METNRPRIIQNCGYMIQPEIENIGGETVVDDFIKDGWVKITTVCFTDHFHIQWNVKMRRSGNFKIYKTTGGYFNDLWNEIINPNLKPVAHSEIIPGKEEQGRCCDYNMGLVGATFYYTAVFLPNKFSLGEIAKNLFWSKTDPHCCRIKDFFGMLREELPEPEKSAPEKLEGKFGEKIKIDQIIDINSPKILKSEMNRQYKFKEDIKEFFTKKKKEFLNGRKKNDLNREELDELRDIENDERRFLLNDVEYYNKNYKV